MIQVIAYDVSDDRLRDRLADLLQGFGRRVQYSVFECRLDNASFEQLQLRLQGLLVGAESAHITGYRLCESCERGSFAIGDSMPEEGAAIWS